MRSSVCHVQAVVKSVEGTVSERAQFQSKLQSLRFYHGPAMLFWTLNPRDSESPLTIRFMADGVWKHHRVPLDIDELAVHVSLNDIRKTDPRALHEMIPDDPVAACECYHTTVRMTL